MELKVFGDFHTHSTASDGRATIAENRAAALRAVLSCFCVSDHGISSLMCHQTADKLRAQAKEIDNLNGKCDSGLKCSKDIAQVVDCGDQAQCGIDSFNHNNENGNASVLILKGIEANITGFDGRLDISKKEWKGLDVLSFGFHRFIKKPKASIEVDCKESINDNGFFKFALTNGFASKSARRELVELNTKAFVRAIESYPVDIVCHLSHRAFVDVKRVAEAAKSNGCYIELNEKHIETLEDGIDEALKSGVNFILGSDAHRADAVGVFPRVLEFVKRHEIPLERIAGIGLQPEFKKK